MVSATWRVKHARGEPPINVVLDSVLLNSNIYSDVHIYIYICSTYTTCTYTHTWGVKISYPYTKKVICPHNTASATHLDFLLQENHPDAFQGRGGILMVVSVAVFSSLVSGWKLINSQLSASTNHTWKGMPATVGLPFMETFWILVDCLVASVGTPCSPVGFSTHLAGEILTSWSRSRLEATTLPEKKVPMSNNPPPPLKNPSPSSRKFLGPWTNFWPLKKHPNAHHFFGSKPQAGLLMGLDIGYIAGVKSRDPKTSKREMLREWTGWPDGRCFMRIHRSIYGGFY